MLHRVVLLRKRTLLISAILLIGTTIFLKWRVTNGYWPWVLLGAGLFPLCFLAVSFVRVRTNAYFFMESTRAEVDRLFSLGAGKKSKLRALKAHLVAHELHLKKTGATDLTVYPYWKHISTCIQKCERPELKLPSRPKPLNPLGDMPGVIDGYSED